MLVSDVINSTVECENSIEPETKTAIKITFAPAGQSRICWLPSADLTKASEFKFNTDLPLNSALEPFLMCMRSILFFDKIMIPVSVESQDCIPIQDKV